MTSDDFLYVTDNTKGYSRKRGRSGFIYLNKKGKGITDRKKIKNFEELVIPPSWKKVWIAPKKTMHIQAYGYDESGRKQYIYNQEWVKINDARKYDKLLAFGTSLPRLRRYNAKHLKKKKWSKKKAAALAVMLLDRHFLRVGNKRYAQQNDTFGISTLKVQHLDNQPKEFSISYKAKGNKKRKIKVGNKRLQRMLMEISEIPGNHIFQYYGRDDQTYTVTSNTINDYIKTYAKGDFTAKDFRTWGATSLTIKYYKKALQDCRKNKRLKLESCVVRHVAERLGNKVSTSRDYYIHPKVLKVVCSRKLKKYESVELPPVSYKKRLKKHEIKTLKVLNSN